MGQATRILFDKNDVPLREGDVIKMFHFTGPRKKKYFMYKVLAVDERFERLGYWALDISELLLKGKDKAQGGYLLSPCPPFEVVSGFGPNGDEDYESRKKNDR